MRKDSGETTQAIDDIIWEHCDESKNGNGIDCRLPWRNRGESIHCTRFYSMFGSLESLLNLEQKHEMVTTISVEVFPGVLQTERKYIGKWREAIEVEMNIQHSETYRRPTGARYVVGLILAPMQEQIPNAFCIGGCEKYENDRGSSLLSAKMRKTSENVKILRVTVQNILKSSRENQRVIRIDTGKKKLIGYASGNFSDFERQKQKGSTVTDYNAVDESDEVHRVMIKVKPLLEASGKRNWRSIMSTLDESPAIDC